MFQLLRFIIENRRYILRQFIRYLKKLLTKNRKQVYSILACCSIALIFVYYKFSKYFKLFLHKSLRSPVRKQNEIANRNKSNSPNINKQFFNELKFLSKIMFPKFFSKQTLVLTLHTLTLVCRTFLSIYVAQLEGTLVKSIVKKNKNSFMLNLLKWLFIAAIPATTCNSLIKYLESQLDLELKTQLVNKSLQYYFKDRMYYQIALKQYDNIQIDQNLSDDIEKLTHLLVHLYSHLTKPILDISVISFTLINRAKEQNFNYLLPTFIGVSICSFTGSLLRLISPKFGQLAAEEAKRKGYLRFLYSRIQTNSEEIAFYGGETKELKYINSSYFNLKKHMETIYLNKLWYIIFEQFLMKYVWSAAGLSMISIPLILSNKKEENSSDGNEISDRTEQFTTARNLLNSAADAVERILTSYKEIIELTGYTRRVYEMFQIFSKANLLAIENPIQKNLISNNDITLIDLTKPSGKTIILNDATDIIIDSISIITPNGDIIVPSLSLHLKEGMNLLITGPNGCGKSSLFRIISGLWPLYTGSIQRPKVKEFFYIPQKPYLPIGNLRDQIIYPDTIDDMRNKNLTDEDLMKILDVVFLKNVVNREGGLNSVADWKDVLSGGEKQRVGLARLFYHRPKYAFLDECTSAISIDVEGKIYQTAKDVYKITLLTIAHRASLWQYHNYILQFDGHGNWKFEELNANLDKRLSLKQEKDSLEQRLLSIEQSKQRLVELCSILGENSIALK